MNLKTAKAQLGQLGMTMRKDAGEYRVTFKSRPQERAEAVAYYNPGH